MAMNKRKTTTAIVAGVTAAALLLGGTFAWTSISQQATNESAGIVNVGGRLHDDFNGKNKDVYVENFTDPLNGGQPIYARVRLDEYMEVGKEAGQADNADREAVPVVENTDINDVDSWTPHVPSDSCAVCATEGTCKIHDHWEWIMGNEDPKVYMPTFNKDKDSLDADINGTYAGTDLDDKVYYDDYVVYTTDQNGEGVGIGIAEDQKEAYNGEIYSVIGTEYYDDDANTDKNDHTVDAATGGYRTEAGVTHTAKQTATATVITMQAWIDGGKTPGNYWVYDTDGWAYWANPIMPGEATGLLLSNIEMTKNPGEKCYYAINVVAEFATVGDWEYFTGINETDNANALELLAIASANVATVTVTNLDGRTTVELGDTVNFSANVTVNGVQVLAASDFEWSVLNADKTESTTSVITDGVLTVGTNELSKNLIVVAKAIHSDYLGALGLNAVAVDVKEPPTFTLTVNDEEDVNVGLYTLNQQKTVNIQAKFGDTTFDDDLVWTVADGNGNELTNSTWRVNETDNSMGTLTVGENETANEIVVTATYSASAEESHTASYRLLSANFEDTHDLAVEPYVMLTSDGSDSGLSMYFVRTAADMTTPADYHIGGQPLTGAYAGTGDWYEDTEQTGSQKPYYNDKDSITNAVFINHMQPTSTVGWYWTLGNLKTITDIKRLDTSAVTNMTGMFNGCSSLEALDVSAFVTDDVTSMSRMFSFVACDIKGLENFNTTNVTTMQDMFANCTGITELDLSKWDVGNVESFDGTFGSNSNLTSINAENWDTSSATSMLLMFANSSLLELDCSKWNVDNVTKHANFNYNAPGVILPLAWQTAE